MNEQCDTATECPRLNLWIGACRFEPRYDSSEPVRSGWGSVEYKGDFEGMKAVSCKVRTYVHDVCIRCGRTVQRPEAP